MIIRLEFSREQKSIYLSHLDLMRAFGRAARRAELPLKYSDGFNPHARMVFGLPLQVGVAGEAECLDMEFERDADPADVAARLNACLPQGVSVGAARIKMAGGNAMSIISHAEYEMQVKYVKDMGRDLFIDLKEAADAFLGPGARIILRKDKPVDLAPLVRSLRAEGDLLRMIVSAGSVNNVKPDSVLECINGGPAGGYGGFARVALRRKALFTERAGILYKPADCAILGDIK